MSSYFIFKKKRQDLVQLFHLDTVQIHQMEWGLFIYPQYPRIKLHAFPSPFEIIVFMKLSSVSHDRNVQELQIL